VTLPAVDTANTSDGTLLVLTVGTTLGLALLAGAGRGGAGLTFGVILLTAADLTRPPLAHWSCALLGAVMLAVAIDPAGDLPSGVLALGTFALLAWAWPHLPDTVGAPLAVVALAGSVVGVYLTVPDTEEILAAAVVVPALGLLAGPYAGGDRPRGLALLGLLTWAAAEGGRGRPGAVVGALACLVLLAAPIVASRIRRNIPNAALARVAVVAVHAAAVLTVARVAGLEQQATTAAAIAGAVLIGAVAADTFVLGASVLIDRRSPHQVD